MNKIIEYINSHYNHNLDKKVPKYQENLTKNKELPVRELYKGFEKNKREGNEIIR